MALEGTLKAQWNRLKSRMMGKKTAVNGRLINLKTVLRFLKIANKGLFILFGKIIFYARTHNGCNEK